MPADDFRLKIAKVLHGMYGNMLRDEDREWDDEPHMIQDDYLRDADVLIRELGLTQWFSVRNDSVKEVLLTVGSAI